jgi:hypothetical protein
VVGEYVEGKTVCVEELWRDRGLGSNVSLSRSGVIASIEGDKTVSSSHHL